MASPTSQASKNVSFRLTGGGTTASLTLPLNPDEAQMDHPARITTTQTLGGIFQDVDDVGVQSLTLQGNTGWRFRTKSGMDGFKAAQYLYNTIYKGYYARLRSTSNVELLVINGVDGYTYKISIDDFQLLRSKSNPLLFQYVLQMTVLQDMAMASTPAADTVQELSSNTTDLLSSAISTAQNRQTTKQTTYQVVSGDTLTGISVKFFGTSAYANRIAQANHITNPNLIYSGQVLVIPPIAA